jgi:hypothetical protein
MDIEKKRAEINWLLFEYGVREDLREDLKKELSSLGVCIVDEDSITDNIAGSASQPDTYYADGVGLSWERNNSTFKAFKDAGFRKVYKLEVSDD